MGRSDRRNWHQLYHGPSTQAVLSHQRWDCSLPLPWHSTSVPLADGRRTIGYMHHLTFGINSLLHSVNLIVFTLLLVHLILRMSPHHSHHLRSHHLSRPPPFTPDLKLISFTNSFFHSHSYSFRTDFTDLSLYCIKGALALVVLVSFSGYVC